MDRPVLSAKAAGDTDPLDLRSLRAIRIPGPCSAIRKLEVAFGDCVDRADVSLGIRDWSSCQRHADRHSRPDRIRGIGRIAGEDRDSDRGVCQTAGRRRRYHSGRGRRTLRPDTSTPDSDDIVRLYPRRCSACRRARSGSGDAPIPGNCGLVRHDRSNHLRSSVHPCLLHDRSQAQQEERMSRSYSLISQVRLSTLLLSLLLEGCSVGPRYKAPTPALAPFHNHIDVPADKAVSAPTLDRWWTGFNDPMLVTVVQRALNQNLDLATALARVSQARAAAAGAGAKLYPARELDASATTERKSLEGNLASRAGTLRRRRRTRH